MATIEQIKALLKMHYEDNDEKFKSIALQIAAHEAKIGHESSAREIRDIVQNSKYLLRKKIIKLPNRLDTIEQRIENVSLKDIVLSVSLMERIERILIEY